MPQLRVSLGRFLIDVRSSIKTRAQQSTDRVHSFWYALHMLEMVFNNLTPVANQSGAPFTYMV